MNKEFGSKFEVGADFWEQIAELIDVLEIPYRATIESQKVGYSLSDFYITLIRIRKGLERVNNPDSYSSLASNLMKRLDDRAPSLFETPLMLCAIYLDPRINFKLTNAQKRDAAMALIKIYERNTELDSSNNKTAINDTLDEIQAEYCSRDGETQDKNSTALLTSLTNFETEKCDIRAPVKAFWKDNGHKYPMIHPLARAIHSVGANQCVTESSFSAFSYLRSPLRRAMDPKNLSNCLMIRLNKSVFDQYRKEQVELIMNS